MHIEKRGAVQILRMEHGKANAIDSEFFDDLQEALTEVEGDGGPVVLTGSGSIFSAGVDLLRVLAGGNDYLDEFVPKLSLGLTRLFALPKPVVAAVNGHAVAGGCILVCACDYRVAAEGTARIGVPELKVGVPFPTAPLEIVRAVVPARYIQEVVYSAKTYTLGDALERGLIDEVVPAEALLDRACEVAEAYGALAPESYALTKRQLRQPVMDKIDAGMRTLDPEIEAVWKAPETHDAIRKYVEKTLRR